MTGKAVAADETVAVPERFDWRGELRGLVLALLAVFAFQSVLAKQFYIPSISMMPGQ